MKLESLREQIRQKYRRDGFTEEQIDDRLNKEWFELLEFRQKRRREGWTEERIAALVKKLQDQRRRLLDHFKTMMTREPRPCNRPKFWPPPQETVRVQLQPCLNCGHQRPLFRKLWWTDGFRAIDWAYHVLECPNCKRTLTTYHSWSPYIPGPKSPDIKYRELSRRQIVGAWNAWNTARRKTTTCAVKDTHRLRDKISVRHLEWKNGS